MKQNILFCDSNKMDFVQQLCLGKIGIEIQTFYNPSRIDTYTSDCRKVINT